MTAAVPIKGELQVALQENVARFRKRNPALAQAVLDACDSEVQVVEGARGGRTVSDRGILLASAYDPRREGEQLAAGMDDQPADLLVALGFGMGFHIEAFRERNPCPILILEPSAARLRAALAARPGLSLLGRKDVSLVGSLEELREAVFKSYTSGLSIRVFPHPSLFRLAPELVKEALRQVRRVKDTSDLLTRTQVLKLEPWTQITVGNTAHLMAYPSIQSLGGTLRGTTAVVCAAGPSLTKQLPLLRERREHLFVIAIGQCFSALREAGIEPDLVHVVEAQDVSHQLERAGGLQDVPLVLPPQAARTLFESEGRYKLIAYQQCNPIGRWIGGVLGDDDCWLSSGGTVAQCAVFLAAFLGASPVLLLGQDLAFTEGKVYAQGTSYDYVGLEDAGESFHFTGMKQKFAEFGDTESYQKRKEDLIWVEGWGDKPVPTSLAYATFRESYSALAKAVAQQGIRVVNCTEGGARIPALEHKAFAEALAETPRRPAQVAKVLRRLVDDYIAPSGVVFELPLLAARRALDAMDAYAMKGRKAADRAKRELPAARSPDHKVELLRKVARVQRRVQEGLADTPFLDALVQPELQRLSASFSKAKSLNPTAGEALEEGALLFGAVSSAIARARILLDAIERNAASRPGSVSYCGSCQRQPASS